MGLANARVRLRIAPITSNTLLSTSRVHGVARDRRGTTLRACDLLGWGSQGGLRDGVAESAEWLSATEVVV